MFAPLVSFKRLGKYVTKGSICSFFSLWAQGTTSVNDTSLVTDSLRYTSALSVALAVVFVVITAGVAIVRLIEGTVEIPKLFPEIDGISSVWNCSQLYLFLLLPTSATTMVGLLVLTWFAHSVIHLCDTKHVFFPACTVHFCNTKHVFFMLVQFTALTMS